MPNQRKTQAQALSVNRRKVAPHLRVAPRSVMSSAEQSVANMRPRFLRNVDFHPALYLFIGVAALTIVAFIYLAQVNAVGNTNYTLQEAQGEHAQLQQQKQNLQLQIARTQSLTNIEKAARDRLHMVPIGDKYEYLPVAPGPMQVMQATTPTPLAGAGSQELGIGQAVPAP